MTALSYQTADADSLTFRAENAAFPAKAGKRQTFDTILSRAFRDIEGPVSDLHSAGQVLEMVMDKTVGKTDTMSDDISFEMTRNEWETLFYAMYQVTNQATALRDSYFKAFERLKTDGTA